MPTFCRHNRLVQNCPICSKEQDVEMRPVVSPGGQAVRPPRPIGSSGPPTSTRRAATARSGSARGGGLTVRRLSRAAEDGFRSALVPGLRSGADAQRLAEELAFAATRLERLRSDPPGLYAEVADASQPLEERSWLAFLIAYLAPVDGDDPFAGIAEARTSWSSGEAPHLDGVATGPRTAHEPGGGQRTIDAYRAWAQRAGSQEAGFTGDAAWAPDRRFARVFERLALPGLHRGARFDLLATLGQLGAYEMSAGALGFGGNDEVTLAAKRVLGIGDALLLERRAAELAAACELPLEALDLGLFNWGRGTRADMGMEPGTGPDPALVASAQAALGL
ncbi:MAG TPA: hypothetical protein VMF14_07030 [Solirubrobacteraceae bacterium]|nr:hypothetical protein [Solirubrobacteraceae bacterium]